MSFAFPITEMPPGTIALFALFGPQICRTNLGGSFPGPKPLQFTLLLWDCLPVRLLLLLLLLALMATPVCSIMASTILILVLLCRPRLPALPVVSTSLLASSRHEARPGRPSGFSGFKNMLDELYVQSSLLTFSRMGYFTIATKEWCVVDLCTMSISLYSFRPCSFTGLYCNSIRR